MPLRSLKKKSIVCNPTDRLYSLDIPTMIFLKEVKCRPGARGLLESTIAYIAPFIIWSSIMKSTVKVVADYRFSGLPKPFEILG